MLPLAGIRETFAGWRGHVAMIRPAAGERKPRDHLRRTSELFHCPDAGAGREPIRRRVFR